MSPIAFFLSTSSTNTHCQPCELEPVGACRANSRHSISTSRDTGLLKSRRLRTQRVVVRTWSTDRVRVMVWRLHWRAEREPVAIFRHFFRRDYTFGVKGSPKI